MKITILQSGYVTGDFLDPVAYAGEMNSRYIDIVHPLFDNCIYQLLVVKESRPYILGIRDGKVMLPPSLTDIACELQCQFMALRNNSDIDISSGNCSCTPTSSNDCSNLIFKSNKFTMTVAEGLNINGLTPIPPYEQLVDIYNNINNAKLMVEKTKLENEQLLETINNKIDELQRLGNQSTLINISKEADARKAADLELENKIKELTNNG